MLVSLGYCCVENNSWYGTHVDGTTAVVLDNLVARAVSATADDVGSAITLDGDSVLADVFEPDVLEGARALAVDTLGLVLADNDVLKSGALLEHEDGIRLSTLGLSAAGTRPTVVLDPTGIEGLASPNVLRLGKGLGTGGGRQATIIAQAGHGRWEGGCESNELC